MASTGQRRRPREYPDELRERAVRMVVAVREETGEKHGAVTRIAKQLGIGTESLRNWVNQAEVDSGRRPGTSSGDAQRIAELEAFHDIAVAEADGTDDEFGEMLSLPPTPVTS